jgi:hypothetical protein
VNDDREGGYFTSRAGRLILALATIGLALAGGVNAFTNIWRLHRPELVLTLFPDDPVAMLNAEDRRWTAAMGASGGLREAAIAASRALRDEPLSPAAFRLLGFAETSERHADKARALMTLAHRLSRRDAATSVWLIHDSAGHGDLQATLVYYDEALLTSADSATVLFPPLAAALFDPAVRHALSTYVRNRPSWMPQFLRFAAEAGTTPDHVASLVIEAGGLPPTSYYDGLHARILGQLAEKSSMKLAQSYLQHVVGIAPGITSDPRFTPQTTDPTLGPFAWRFIDQPEIGSALDDQGALQVRAATDRQGVVVRRVLIASAGTYDFTQSVKFPPGTPMARLRWEVRCFPATPVEPIWAQDLPMASAPTIYAFSVTIPDHCPAQEFSLIAGNDNAQEEAQATIGALRLKPRLGPK